jgi:hypothetical protein
VFQADSGYKGVLSKLLEDPTVPAEDKDQSSLIKPLIHTFSNNIEEQMLSSVIPSVNAKWEVKEVPTPQAGTNQVLIKIHTSGICYTDVHISKGGLGVNFPYTIGHEPVAEIALLAEFVSHQLRIYTEISHSISFSFTKLVVSRWLVD